MKDLFSVTPREAEALWASPPCPLGGPMLADYLAVTRAAPVMPLWPAFLFWCAPLAIAARWAAAWGMGVGALVFLLTLTLVLLTPDAGPLAIWRRLKNRLT